ncbi:class I SAM-dependent methyltransferase [Amycolatopsis sp. NPDC059021]|uniref:class I SAM-dependent methyltransferase n=1 Tax=Amycolatopsis sp. NPDC059021 TaxID=3346704 RepID=UPI003671CA0C
MSFEASPPGELDPRIVRAQSVYTKRVLAIYDLLVLGVFCSFVWRCPPRLMRSLYDRSVGEKHLELGPGTGYFVDRCRFPVPRPEITLLDLHEECLRASRERIARYAPESVVANLLEPLPLPGKHYDSAALNLVFHTIPGGWAAKGVVFEHVAACLKPGGVLFGSTVLARQVPMNRVTRYLMREQHRRGNFQNQPDDVDGLREQLAKHFPSFKLAVHGCVAVFEATAP